MASSPPSPFPATLPNTKKRPSMSSQVSVGPLNKRPKLHPLRQTSFPANSEAVYASAASARSETASIAPSTFSTTSTARIAPRGRGRPRKSLQVTDEDAQTLRESTTGGAGARSRNTGKKATTSKSVISAARSGAAGNNLDDEDDEDDEDEVHDDEEDDEENANEKDNIAQREADRFNTFLGQLTEAQMNRYQNYRSSSLKTSVIRRIVNQTVSQSVGKTQIDAVQFFSKAFAIEIIERAREIQVEWAGTKSAEIKREKETRRQKLEEREEDVARKQKRLEEGQKEQQVREVKIRQLANAAEEASIVATEEEKAEQEGEKEGEEITATTATSAASSKLELDKIKEEYKTTLQTLTTLRAELTKLRAEIPKLRTDAEKYLPNKHQGGLMPDHLREALRRYKADGEGGGFGFDGVSHPLLGVEGAVAWRVGDGNVGQRLFR